MDKAEADLIPAERIESRILLLRGQKVLLDHDLAALYEIPTKALKRAVKRNAVRFPDDFMFVLDEDELADLRCQFGTSSSWGGLRYPPMAFTEQGVAMLSGVLNSPRAIQVNIAIMRAFVRLLCTYPIGLSLSLWCRLRFRCQQFAIWPGTRKTARSEIAPYPEITAKRGVYEVGRALRARRCEAGTAILRIAVPMRVYLDRKGRFVLCVVTP